MDTIIVDALGHPIYFSDIFSSERIIQMCRHEFENVFIVTDKNVGAHYTQKLLNYLARNHIRAQFTMIPPGEHSKSRELKRSIEDMMFALGCGRDTIMIALGGGVVTDLAGFIAATYCRGIPIIYIPTSLLAMVDAANGGKTGINTDYGKNLIGTFTNPEAVFIDINLLNTLPENEYLLAFSEIIKHALIFDDDYFTLIESHIGDILKKDYAILSKIVKRSCEIKMLIISEDQAEKSKREMLNFGHTIAHALETLSQYAINHGQAVAIGIIAESYLSNQMKLLSDAHFHRIKQLILNLNIPVTVKATLSKGDLIAVLNRDKKIRKNKHRFVLLEKIGAVAYAKNLYAQPVAPILLDKLIDYLISYLTSSLP